MTPFAFHKPQDVAGAKALLAASADAAVLAGGMTLVPTLKNRLREVSSLIDLSGISELSALELRGDALHVGAMSRHADVATNHLVRSFGPALAKLADGIGDPQVRNRGTIGGSLANNDPAADWPAAVLAYNAQVITTAGPIAADQFFTGMFETALPAGELITGVVFPRMRAAAYAKFRHPASGYAVAGVFVARAEDGVRVAVTGAVSQVQRWHAAESALAANFSAESIAGLAFESDDLMNDMHASADYRAHLVGVMLQRAVVATVQATI
jgi:aerobic carbon-monoxide dehydrogenase medium subunit